MNINYEKRKQNRYKTRPKQSTPQQNTPIETNENSSIPVSSILPDISEFYISFPNSELTDLTNNNQKIKMKKNQIYKIFSMLKIPQSKMSPYILFSFTYVKSEMVTNTVTTFQIDYKKVMRLTDYFYIQLVKNNDEDIEISKKSLLKIFDMLRLSTNDRLSLMQFFQVDEDVEIDEDENNNSSLNKQNNNNLRNSTNKNFNKLKINYIGSNLNFSDKLDLTSLDNLKKITEQIPFLLDEAQNNNKNKLSNSKKVIIEGEVKKVKTDDIDSTLIKIRTIEKKNIANEKLLKNTKNYKGYKLPPKEEPHSKKTVSLRVKNRPPPPKKKKNVCNYAFILRKLPEYGDSTIFLLGSLKKLGNWDIRFAISMDEEIRNEQHFYTKYMDIKKNEFPFEYKYFYFRDNQPVWIGNGDKNFKAHKQYFKLYHTIKKNIISIWDLNIRYLNDLDGLNIWDFRKEKLIQAVLNSYADILFFQEITRTQYEYIDEYLNSVYEFVGIYRDNTDKSEKCSISYNIFKYTLSDWGQFWLSSTPYEPGSNDFKNFFPRICTWAALKQINGDDFIFFNVHLDHVNFSAHMPCINVVIEESEKILKKFPETKFVFLGGCFYCEEDDPIIIRLKSCGFIEVMFENTFHDFTGEADRHFDYMFWKERKVGKGSGIQFKKVIVPKEDSIVNKEKQMYISDHYPVYTEFEQVVVINEERKKKKKKSKVKNKVVENTNVPEEYVRTVVQPVAEIENYYEDEYNQEKNDDNDNDINYFNYNDNNDNDDNDDNDDNNDYDNNDNNDNDDDNKNDNDDNEENEEYEWHKKEEMNNEGENEEENEEEGDENGGMEEEEEEDND